MTADLRARIAAALRDHQPPTHTDSRGLPPDEFDCCADVEHRDEALANGIPADLIDMLIADADGEER